MFIIQLKSEIMMMMIMMQKACSHSYKRAAAPVAVCTLLSAPHPQFAPSLLSPAAHCSTGLAGYNLHQPIRECVVAPPQYPTHESHLTAAQRQKRTNKANQSWISMLSTQIWAMARVINYSPSCHFKPARHSFIFRTQIQIFLMNS